MPKALRNAFDLQKERLELSQESFAFAITSREESPESLQGMHSRNMLILVDEASGVDDKIFETLMGAMTTPGAKTLMTGNPTRAMGYFYNAFTRSRNLWHTMRVACVPDPGAYDVEDAPFARKAAFAEEIELNWGKESDVYRYRVLGEFPAMQESAVIPIEWMESSIDREVEGTDYFPVWGLDVARSGSNRTALAKRRGNVLLEPLQWWSGKDNMQVANMILHEYRETEEKPTEIVVDVIGVGAGVVDRLREMGLPVRGLNIHEGRPTSGLHARPRDEYWWMAREWFESRSVTMPRDDMLIGELSSVQFSFNPMGKIQVESKDDMKKRGMVSPDLADAFILTFAGGRSRIPIERDRYHKYRERKKSSAWAV